MTLNQPVKTNIQPPTPLVKVTSKYVAKLKIRYIHKIRNTAFEIQKQD